MAIKEKIVVGVADMPGAGKATVKEMVERLSYPVVVMGDEIREETMWRGLKPTPENVGMVMLKLREEEGPAVVAKRCIPKIEKAPLFIYFINQYDKLLIFAQFSGIFFEFCAKTDIFK